MKTTSNAYNHKLAPMSCHQRPNACQLQPLRGIPLQNLYSVSVHLAGGLELGIFWSPIPAMVCMRTQLLADVFGHWRLITVLRVAETLRSKLVRLQTIKRAESIWHMKKEQLIDVAIQELGMTQEIASKETVVTLREKIRSRRKSQNAVIDPLGALPKGLARMPRDELAIECIKRGMDPFSRDRPGHKLKTSSKMITMIRDSLDLVDTSGWLSA